MSTSPSQSSRDFNSSIDEQTPSITEQKKQDALDFAELLYEIFVASQASGNMGEKG